MAVPSHHGRPFSFLPHAGKGGLVTHAWAKGYAVMVSANAFWSKQKQSFPTGMVEKLSRLHLQECHPLFLDSAGFKEKGPDCDYSRGLRI